MLTQADWCNYLRREREIESRCVLCPPSCQKWKPGTASPTKNIRQPPHTHFSLHPRLFLLPSLAFDCWDKGRKRWKGGERKRRFGRWRSLTRSSRLLNILALEARNFLLCEQLSGSSMVRVQELTYALARGLSFISKGPQDSIPLEVHYIRAWVRT